MLMDRSAMEGAVVESQRAGQLQGKSDTYKKLKEDLLRSRRAVSVMMGEDAVKVRVICIMFLFCLFYCDLCLSIAMLKFPYTHALAHSLMLSIIFVNTNINMN